MTYEQLKGLPATAAAEAAGFQLASTGGPCWAYVRDVPDGHVEVTDYLQSLTGNPNNPLWCATRYRADADTATCTQRDNLSLADALTAAPELPLPTARS